MDKFKIIDFKKKWKYLKTQLNQEDIDFFEKVIDIEGTVGRVDSFSDKPYNPRYIEYWFPVCRCHFSVIFPCWLLNGRKAKGKYKILTNDLHSAIINTETNEVFDPTYAANGVDPKNTLEKFAKEYSIVDLIIHASMTNSDLAKRMFVHLQDEPL